MTGLNCKIVDGLVQQKYLQNRYVYVSDNNNLWFGNCALNLNLKVKDGIHLTDRGVSLLVSYIRKAMHIALDIKITQKLKCKEQDRNNFNNYRLHGQFSNGFSRWGRH